MSNEMNKVKIPESIKEHQSKYKEGIWQTYSVHELGMWVHLFLKRATHRSDKTKAIKLKLNINLSRKAANQSDRKKNCIYCKCKRT